MKIIDTHQHVFWHGRDDRGLIEDLDQHGIERAWLLTWEISVEESDPKWNRVLNPFNLRPDGTHRGIVLEDLVRCRDRYPDRFDLGYCPHPLEPGAPDLLEAAVQMYRVRICGEWKFRLLIDDPRSLLLLRRAGELKLPVVLHLDVAFLPVNGRETYMKDWSGGTIENLERAMLACPETQFIGHAPGFWREISGDADSSPDQYTIGPVVPGGRLGPLFERCPNLHADLSAGSGLRALQRDPGYACEFLERWQDRLLFGRDYYGGEHQEFLNNLGLPEEVLAKIYHRNAERLLFGTEKEPEPWFKPLSIPKS